MEGAFVSGLVAEIERQLNMVCNVFVLQSHGALGEPVVLSHAVDESDLRDDDGVRARCDAAAEA